MKIAIPVSGGRLCMHFGHCEEFLLFDVDTEKRNITASESVIPPPHEPGLLPKWLSGRGVNCVIAGGMGGRAVSLFRENGVKVITGAASGDPAEIINSYLNDSLQTGANACDH